jgi:hypothetical protein
MKNKTNLFTVNLLHAGEYLILKTTHSAMLIYTLYVKISHVSETRTDEANALNSVKFYCSLSSSMGQNISWEDSGYLWKSLLRVTCNLICHYPVQNVPPPVCILCPLLTFRTVLHCLLKIYFHFFPSLMSRFSSSVVGYVIPIKI